MEDYQEIIENGIIEVMEFDVIPKSFRTRITKAKYSLDGIEVIQEIEYCNSVNSNSVYAIKNERRYVSE